METWGAQGGTTTKSGGKGGYTSGNMALAKNTTIYIYVGENGNKANTTFVTAFNGGGLTHGTSDSYSRGGGGTDFRLIGGDWDNDNSLRSRILVAGGGGGAGMSNDEGILSGGHAGGLISYMNDADKTASYGQAVADQTSGWRFGSGRPGYGCQAYSGSGGGWWGGKSSGQYDSDTDCNGHGTGGHCGVTVGGSSYISGHTGAVGVTSTSDSSPKSGCTTGTTNNACSLTPYINPATGTSYTFTNTLMIDGAGYKWTNTKQGLQQMPNPAGGYYASGVGHSGNGAARITYLGTVI